MAETESMDVAKPVSPGEVPKSGARPVDRQGLLKHSREFLDFFWDIAKPQQETRLEATEKLLEYLRAKPKGSSEMKYALKRLITGLGVGRETARPCYSLALAQLLQSFEDIPLSSILQQVQEKYNLQKVKKGMMRPALFANLFGVLALFQSGRLVKDSEVLMKSVKLLQALAQHHNHLQEQPQKALVDILSEVPEAVLEEVLPKVLKTELNSILGSPEHLELFLLAQQKVPKKLEKLMGPVNLFADEGIPRLVTVLKAAATSVKKERKLPAVALDLLRLALREDKFPRFWKEVVEQGLLKKQSWPASYLCFRLLGTALPLLSEEQLQLVMRGDLIRHYGEHTVTAKLPNHYKFAPEMTQYVEAFLEGCQDDSERQLAMVVAFTSVTNQGLPIVPTFWRVLCKSLLPIVVEHVASHGQPRHQAQACLLLQKTLPTRELRLCFKAPEWEQLLGQILGKVTENLRTLGEAETKPEHQKELSSLELLNTVFKNIRQEKLTLDLTGVLGVLQSQQPRLQQKLQQEEHLTGTGSSRLYDLYWQAMKTLGVQRPKSEKGARDIPEAPQSPVSTKRKKKGFLPETKKRKKRKSEGAVQEEEAKPAAASGEQPPSTGKKRRNKRRTKKLSQVNGTPATKSPAPETPAVSPSSPTQTPELQKKNRKVPQVKGTTPESLDCPEEPTAAKKRHMKNLPAKGTSGRSPQSALPRKKVRLSLGGRSPSLLQSGARKKGPPRKGKKL
uniref:MYB binding protein 1a n=1 Tax=Catagonus wagneri TaxID=51154 RepID=A0A8C3YV63_9CETA